MDGWVISSRARFEAPSINYIAPSLSDDIFNQNLNVDAYYAERAYRDSAREFLLPGL